MDRTVKSYTHGSPTFISRAPSALLHLKLLFISQPTGSRDWTSYLTFLLHHQVPENIQPVSQYQYVSCTNGFSDHTSHSEFMSSAFTFYSTTNILNQMLLFEFHLFFIAEFSSGQIKTFLISECDC